MVPSGSMAQLDLLAKWIYSKFGFYATPRTNRNTKSNMTAETNEMASLEPVLKKLSELAPRPEKLTTKQRFHNVYPTQPDHSKFALSKQTINNEK